ncbi:MAG: hypothetical protein GY759_21265 [Chloroflexi bacterium]|nr:hypothetical protein [Chloroflexota bacterium]
MTHTPTPLPTVTPTPTHTATLTSTFTHTPTLTHTLTPTPVDATWRFSGRLLLQADPDPQPAPDGIQITLFGSETAAEPGERLAVAQSSEGGLFDLTYEQQLSAAQRAYDYLNLIVTDSRYEVRDVWSESGGEANEQNWLQFFQTVPGHYSSNGFVLSSKATATPTPTPVPTGVVAFNRWSSLGRISQTYCNPRLPKRPWMLT